MASELSLASEGRFVSKAEHLFLKGRQVTVDVIGLLLESTSYNIPTILQGLQQELQEDSLFNSTWTSAQNHQNQSRYLEQNIEPALHVALRTYAYKRFYQVFNDATRLLEGADDVAYYPYKNYFKLLFIAVTKVRGNPDPYKIGNLFRGVRGHVDFDVGDEMYFQHFISTSQDEQVAIKYAGGKDEPRTLFVIGGMLESGKSKVELPYQFSGIPRFVCLDHIGYNNHECLIWPVETFKVVGKQDNEDGLRVIMLRAG